MACKKSKSAKTKSTASLGIEAKHWLTDKHHNNMDAAEYKHVVLGLISPFFPDCLEL